MIKKMSLLVSIILLATVIVFSTSGCTSLSNSRYDLGNPLSPSELVKKPAGSLDPQEVQALKRFQPGAFQKAEPERVFTPPVGVTLEKLEPTTSANPLDEALPYAIIALWRHNVEPSSPQLAVFKPPTRAVFLF